MSDLASEAKKIMGAENANVPDGYREVKVEFFKFENIGDSLRGRLVGKDQTVMNRGNRIGKYTVVMEDKTMVNFLGAVELDELMRRVAVGAEVFIQYTHSEKLDGGNEMKHFTVAVKQSSR